MIPFARRTLETAMVDVSKKTPTVRSALAQSEIWLNPGTYSLLKNQKLEKGDAIAMAEIAGIMASKRTQDLIPLCHQINLDFARVNFEWNHAESRVKVLCEVQVTDKTGCEMEALTGAMVAASTVYDMCKGH
jgi:cyclic pyranopterin monophosphate synthase